MLQSSFTHQEKRKLFMGEYEKNKEEVDFRIAKGIEENRKGTCRVRFTDTEGKGVANQKVKLTQKKHDFKYGANIFMLDEFQKEEDNAEYRKMFKEYFNLATVPFYWDAIEPEEGKLRYAVNSPKIYRRPAPDLCLQYCVENGIDAKLHCLAYEAFVPEWLKKMSLEQAKEKYEERFRQIAQRYAGRMMEFEVVNEMQNCVRGSKMGSAKDRLKWWFDLGRKYFPKETLVINEGSRWHEFAGMNYLQTYYMMIENALLKGATIDKIGMQCHQFTGEMAKNQEEYDKSIQFNTYICNPMIFFQGLDMLGEFGLPLEITEVTASTLGDTEEDEQLQADLIKLWYSIWFSHPLVDTIVYWNTVDGYAHVNSASGRDENNCLGGLFHHDLTPKKSALMIKKLFQEEWHTELEAVTDEDGWVEFRGFYGDYVAESNGLEFEIGVHKNECNTWNLKL